MTQVVALIAQEAVMPGKPGSGGPVPKRSEQRRRRNKAPEGAETTFAPSAGAPTPPPVDLTWHPGARSWFESLAESGQSAFFEASDWEMAKLAAHLMTTIYNSGDRPSAQMVASLLQLTTNLMTTEGDRRRLRLELSRGPQVDEDEQASVTALSDYMTRAGG